MIKNEVNVYVEMILHGDLNKNLLFTDKHLLNEK